MKRSAEVTLFAGLAALIHVSLFASAPESGVQSSGAGGEAMVSIEAASATVAEMVEAWERPPPRPQMVKPELEQPLTPPDAPQMQRQHQPQPWPNLPKTSSLDSVMRCLTISMTAHQRTQCPLLM